MHKNGGKVEQIYSNDIHTTLIKKTADLPKKILLPSVILNLIGNRCLFGFF